MLTGRIRKMKFWRKTLFIKFFLSVLLVSVISVILLTLLMFYWFQEKTSEDISTINRMELLNTEVAFSKYVNIAQNIAMELYQSNNIKSVMLSEDTGWTENSSIALSQVHSVITVNKFINSIYVFNKNVAMLTITNKAETLDAQKELFNRVKSRNVANGPFIWDMQTINDDTVHTMTVFFHDNITGKGDIDGAIAVNIDLDELKNNIFTEQANNSQTILIIGSDGKMVMQSGKGQIGYNPDKTYIKRILSSEAPDGMFKAIIDKHDISLSFITSKDTRYKIISEMEYQQSISKLIKQRNTLFTACVIIILFIIGVSLIISYVIYKPLGVVFNNIRSLFNDSVTKDKETSEIQLITNTLTRMVDRINSLEKENESNTVVKIMTCPDNQGGKLSADLLARAEALSALEMPFTIIVIKIDDYKNFAEKNNDDAILFQVNSICTISIEFFSGNAYCSAYRTADDCIALIVSELKSGRKLYEINMVVLAKDLQEIIRKMLRFDVIIGVSRLTSDIKKINEKYHEALLLTKYRIFYDNCSVFHADIIDKLKNGCISEEYIDVVLDAVKKASFEGFITSLENLIILCRDFGYEKSVETFSQLAAAILKLSNDIANEHKSNHLDIYKKVTELSNLNELKDWFTQLFQDASIIINDVNRKKTRDIIKEAIDYIDMHYWEQQLSVNSMSDRTSISPWYFSRIFNEITGCSFPDYVNNLRLDKAKGMLKENRENNINEIADKTGFRNSSYFTIAFKKKFGMTPSKWRLNNK